MFAVDMTGYAVNTSSNRGINKERTVANYYGIVRDKHDSKDYKTASDIEIDDMRISVKSPAATLYSGNMTKGCKTFEGIWRRYRKNVHSNVFVFVTNDFIAYYMNIDEFSKFIHKFGYLHHESTSKGGGLKICIRDNHILERWLAERVA